MGRQLYLLGWLVSVLLLSIPATVRAEVQEEQENSALAMTQAKGVEAEVAQGTTVQVTAVRLNPTADGLEIILETIDGQALSPTTSVIGNALIADIPNAVLALPDGNEFQQANPIEGIALVSVTQRGDGIRVAITGIEAPPTVEVRAAGQALMLSVTPGAEEAAGAEEDAIQVVVTGEQDDDGYAVNEATTATRTDTPLRDIPRSIQVIPQQVLEDQAVVRVGDATRNVSGVVQDGGFGGTIDQFNIRGFFTTEVLENGFRNRGNIGLAETANIERIEVLKGPASILVGNVEPGGIINLITEQPQEDPAYEVGLQGGSFTFVRPTLDFTGPLTNDRNLLYRLNLAYEYSDGFRDFEQDVDRLFVAPVLAWRLGENTTVTFDFTHLRDDRPIDRGLVAIGDGIANIPVQRILGEPNDIRSVRATSVGYRVEHNISEDWTLRNRFNYFSSDNFDLHAEPGDLNEETGILERSYRYSDGYDEAYNLQADVTGRVTTGSIAHNLLFGADLSLQTNRQNLRRLPEGETPGINIFDPEYDVIDRPDREDFTSVANDYRAQTNLVVFLLQDLIEITDNLKLLLNGRLDIVNQDELNFSSGITSGQAVNAFSPTVGIVYQPIEPISLYANYARSFNPNFGIRADGSFIEPERGTQYEIGIRAELNGNLVASLAAYHLTKTNVATTDPDNPDFSIAIGEQRSQGIEFDIGGEILPGWNLIASYGYIDAEVTESNDIPEGSKIDGVPEHTASLWTAYELQSGSLQGLGFGVGLFYVGERQGDGGSYSLPDYLRTDAALFYRRDSWRAAINVQNLFDQRYFESINYGRTAIEPGAPLTIIGSVIVEF
jgi:iron complex outermembrane receptor protein